VSAPLPKLRSLGLRFWITFAFACLIAEGIEMAVHHVAAQHSEGDGYVDSLLVASGLYQRIATTPRTPAVHFTTVVEIDAKHDIPSVSLYNVCAERLFLARLLHRIAVESPSVVVIDKVFGATRCPADDPGTAALMTSIRDARTTVPVLVGIEAEAITPPLPDGARATHTIVEGLKLGTGPSEAGVVNVATDHRKLPIEWLVYPDAKSARENRPVALPSLAFAAAKLHEKRLLQDSPHLAELVKTGEQPFVGFLETSRFEGHRAYAGEVLCGRRLASNESWLTCDGTLPAPITLRGRVVLIGENDERVDQYRSIVGRIPGYYLHANYIEALLDDRYLIPAGLLFDILFSFAFLALLELILVLLHDSLWQAATGILLLCLVSMALLYMIVVHARMYVDPSLITGTALLIKVLHLAYAQVPGIRHGRDRPGRGHGSTAEAGHQPDGSMR